jgi:hypothetical protein
MGETVSLSTVDVHTAFATATTALGLPGAVAVAVVRQALLSVGISVGVGGALRNTKPAHLGRFTSGLAGAYVGQALPAVALMYASDIVDPALVSLALGTLLHTLNEVTFCFLALAGVVCLNSGAGARRPPARRSSG